MRTQIVPTIIQLNAIKWNISNYKYKDDGKFDKLLVHMIMESESDFTQTSASMWKKPVCVWVGGVDYHTNPDSKVHGASMGPIWGWQDPGGPHVGPMNLTIWEWHLFETGEYTNGPIPMDQYISLSFSSILAKFLLLTHFLFKPRGCC